MNHLVLIACAYNLIQPLIKAVSHNHITNNILTQASLTNCFILDASKKTNSSDAVTRTVTINGIPSIIKQIIHESLDEQFLLINDYLASNIGCSMRIHVNHVSLIPATINHPAKIFPERAATIHTIVPGKDIETVRPDFLPEWFMIQQRICDPNSPWQKKWPLSENEQGLAKMAIQSMNLHPDLPALIALDTFLGNSDRSYPNTFYDGISNHFYGIDQAAAFHTPLAQHACNRIKELMETHYFKQCTPDILKSLKMYRDTLKQLYIAYRPKDITQAMHIIANYVTTKHNLASNEILENRIQAHRKIIEENYTAIKQLIDLIDEVV